MAELVQLTAEAFAKTAPSADPAQEPQTDPATHALTASAQMAPQQRPQCPFSVLLQACPALQSLSLTLPHSPHTLTYAAHLSARSQCSERILTLASTPTSSFCHEHSSPARGVASQGSAQGSARVGSLQLWHGEWRASGCRLPPRLLWAVSRSRQAGASGAAPGVSLPAPPTTPQTQTRQRHSSEQAATAQSSAQGSTGTGSDVPGSSHAWCAKALTLPACTMVPDTGGHTEYTSSVTTQHVHTLTLFAHDGGNNAMSDGTEGSVYKLPCGIGARAATTAGGTQMASDRRSSAQDSHSSAQHGQRGGSGSRQGLPRYSVSQGVADSHISAQQSQQGGAKQALSQHSVGQGPFHSHISAQHSQQGALQNTLCGRGCVGVTEVIAGLPALTDLCVTGSDAAVTHITRTLELGLTHTPLTQLTSLHLLAHTTTPEHTHAPHTLTTTSTQAPAHTKSSSTSSESSGRNSNVVGCGVYGSSVYGSNSSSSSIGVNARLVQGTTLLDHLSWGPLPRLLTHTALPALQSLTIATALPPQSRVKLASLQRFAQLESVALMVCAPGTPRREQVRGGDVGTSRRAPGNQARSAPGLASHRPGSRTRGEADPTSRAQSKTMQAVAASSGTATQTVPAGDAKHDAVAASSGTATQATPVSEPDRTSVVFNVSWLPECVTSLTLSAHMRLSPGTYTGTLQLV